MKENKNWVFALKATEQSEKMELGYLAFPDDKQALEFLAYSERIKAGNPEVVSEEHTSYEAHNWIIVSKNEGEHIHNNGMLFLEKIELADTDTLKQILELNKPVY